MKNLSKRYWAPSSLFWTKVGDAVVHLGTMITTYSVLHDSKYWAIASLFLVWAGSTIPKFTKADESK